MIKVGMYGVTGYTGIELLRWLNNHSVATVIGTFSSSLNVGDSPVSLYPHLAVLNKRHDITVKPFDFIKECDVLFLAVPHGEAINIVAKLEEAKFLDKVKVIDLSSDFRLKSKQSYEKWYGKPHPSSQEVINSFVYGLSELFRDKIKGARFISNPGCYPTSIILPLYPLLKERLINVNNITINSVSGTSGAGKKLSQEQHFAEMDNNFYAYGVNSHRHTPEIEDILFELTGSQSTVSFTPHIAPIVRGMVTTINAELDSKVGQKQLEDLYNDYYKDEQFIRLLTGTKITPSMKLVANSNLCAINALYDARTGKTIIMSSIDNLVKGASGQAVQNMNIMFGLKEEDGISVIPNYLN